MSFGARLRALRVANKMTQKEVSEKSGIALRHYQDLEADNHKPGLNGLVSLARIFRVSVDYMLEIDFSENPSLGLPSYFSMSDKKALVFTRMFSGAEEERAEVFKALLETDCICTGLIEVSASMDEDGRKLMEQAIYESDYYFLILSLSDGIYSDKLISAMEKEYAYAARLGRPIVVLARKPADDLENRRLDFLDAFFRLSSPKATIFDQWQSHDELGKTVCRIALQLRRRHTPIGWIRGNCVTKEQLQRERDLLERLRLHEDRLEKNRC